MGRHLPYKPRNYAVGQTLLTLRTRTKLTQAELAALVGVNRRSIQHWENGETYPKEDGLQRLIAAFLAQGVFTPGQEQVEVAQLWEQISEAAPRHLALFDVAWFARLLEERASLPTAVAQSATQVDTTGTTLPTGLVTFLATDIEGSTQRWEHAPQAMQQALTRHHAILRQLTALYQGQVLHTAGDSFICVYADAPTALQSALAIQRALIAEPWPEAVAPLRVRMALHSGAATTSAEGYVAEPTLNRLSRVLTASQGGQIVLTQAAVDLIGTGWPEGIIRRDLGVQLLRDVTVPLQLWQAVAPDLPTEVPPGHVPSATIPVMDWGEANDVPILYGREAEQATLEQWVLVERCRVVALLGLGGIGKTSLAITLAQQLAPRFEVVLFRSLRNAPPLGPLLDGLIGTASLQQITPPDTIADKIARLVQLCRERRCLLVLDNLETIMQAGDHAGDYRADYADYGELVVRFSEMQHRSCLLLTSREKPVELGPLEGPTATVRSLILGGLAERASQIILAEKALNGTDADWVDLAHRYGGNPLALKLVAGPIRELFGGDVAAFLSASEPFFNSVGRLLEQQVSRASVFEQSLLVWLAIEREPTSLDRLLVDLGQMAHRGAVVAALEALQHRSLIERGAGRLAFTLQPVILEYITERLVHRVCEEIVNGQPERLRSHALVQATAKDYVRRSQERLIATPLLERLTASYGDTGEVERLLLDLLGAWRDQRPTVQGYGPGNVVNLLRVLRGNLRGLDLSRLFIRHAYLPEVVAQDARLVHTHVSETVFAEAFDYSVSVALSADGRYLAAGTTSGEVRLWQVADRTPILSVQAHLGMVWSVTFTADGQMLASGGTDGSIRLWETASGRCLAVLPGQVGMVSGVALSADGRFAAGCGTNGNIQLWETAQQICVATLEGHTGAVWDVTLSADGQLLASAGLDGTVRLWEAAGSTCRAVLHEHTDVIYSVALSKDGGRLASGSGDGTVRLWDTSSGACQAVIEGRSGMIYSVALSADGQQLASSGTDGTIRLWETSGGACRAVLQGHAGVVRGVALAADGQLLVSGGGDGTIRVWEPASGTCLAVLQGRSSAIYSVVLGMDGQQLASGSSDGTIRLWETGSAANATVLHGHTGVVWSVALRADNRLLASGGTDGMVRLWDVASGTCLASLPGHTGIIYSVALTPDGQLLASGSTDGMVRLWDVDSRTCLASLPGHTGQIWSVALSVDGRLLASGGGGGTVRLWETGSKTCQAVLLGHTGAVLSVALSADGRLLVSGGADGTVRVWETSSGACRAVLEGHTGFVWGVAVAADGQLLASGGTDGGVRLWDVASGAVLHTLEGHSGMVRSVAFATGGRLLASAGLDGTVRLWDVAGGTMLGTLRPERPYERLDITGLTGVTEAQTAALKALGAVERGYATTAHHDRARPISASPHRPSPTLVDVANADGSPQDGRDLVQAQPVSASNPSDTPLADSLLATKYFVPAAAHSLIARPRLIELLDAGRQRPLTLVSAPPGFGKTTLLAQWLRQNAERRTTNDEGVQIDIHRSSLVAHRYMVAWVSLDENDNDLVRFWLYVLTALDRCQPGLTEALIGYVRRQQAPPIHSVVTMLINALAQSATPVLLVLDDYHVITEAAIHRSLAYLLEHLPPQLRLMIATRTDPPLPLALLRARGQILELRLDQLRATGEEVDTFLRQAMGLSLTPRELAVVTDRTEGWLAGLQLVGLALRDRSMSIDLLEQVSGQQGFILDYLTEEVLRQQPEAVQTFLLRTTLLDRMCAPLCEAVLGSPSTQFNLKAQVDTPGPDQVSTPDAQSMLEHLERTNLFVVPLDTQRRWYRYHTLFAEALHTHLKRRFAEEIPTLYLRASRWYEQQGDIYTAIQYAGQARDWQRVADLIEPIHQIGYQGWQQRTVRRWIEQIPGSILDSRPQLCIVYAMTLFVAGALLRVEDWLRAAEIGLTSASIPKNVTPVDSVFTDDVRTRLLGAIAARRAGIAGYYGDRESVELQAQRALASLSEQDDFQRAVVTHAQGLLALSFGQVVVAAERMRAASTRMHAIGSVGAAINWLSVGASYVQMRGHLHAAWQMYQQASELGTESRGLVSSEVGVTYAYQADVLREWNQLGAALTLVQQGLDLTEQAGHMLYIGRGYVVLARIFLSQGAWDAANAALQRALQLPTFADNPYQRAWLVAVDQVRLWIARGALDEATGWAATLDESARPTSPFAREREDVALSRIDLAQGQPAQALARLEPLVASATATERWDHVIEMRILQSLAREQLQDEQAALAALAEAVRLGEPEGYIRRFVDEGPQVAALLVLLRDQQRRHGPTPYLDMVVAAFSK